MLFKEDWDKCKERFDAFWEGEMIDRCCIAIYAPRRKPVDSKYELREARDLIEKWTDSEFLMNQAMHYFSNTYFGGEAFPLHWVNLGPGVAASFIGASYVLAEDTVWFDRNPIIHDWNNMPEIRFDENSEMWKIVYGITEDFLEKAKGNYFVGITDLGGNLDIAASLRGTQNLLLDIYDNPEGVKSLVNKIDEIWFSCYSKLQELINKYMEGTSAWMGLWCRQRWYPLQCDFSAMLSPAMFEEFVKPSLSREAEFLDKSIYHLDGPGEIPHLDHLLDIDRLTGIQWTPGAGNPNVCDEKWYPMYKRIQEKGKNLVLLGAEPGNVEKLLDNLSPKGLYISTWCETEDDCRELLKIVEKRSIRRYS